MSTWTDLSRELDAWGDQGQDATFWWRDDDAVGPSQALSRMLSLADLHRTPLALAVIPNRAEPALAEELCTRSYISVLQHGYEHTNHEPKGYKKAELGGQRKLAVVLNELSLGLNLLKVFDQGEAILVPPWNRICPDVVEQLHRLGFNGVSTFTPREGRFAASNLGVVNTHVDIMDWHGGRGFVGNDVALEQAVTHLKARRLGQCDASEPTGLLSHHLVHDKACWTFLQTFIDQIVSHDAARIVSITEALPT
ncbi:MAG: polysaccharide deacetylase family protein [Magnetovibrio sp.]|nr:polysaccharide deacetylase family protein [Magnetovibrio sp.]